MPLVSPARLEQLVRRAQQGQAAKAAKMESPARTELLAGAAKTVLLVRTALQVPPARLELLDKLGLLDRLEAQVPLANPEPQA